jgi:gamma-glutamyl phosphate reductase
MYGTNTYIIEITKEILRKNNLNPDMINQFITEDYQSILKNTTSIDLVVCIGNKELQSIVLEQSKTKTLISGHENFEIYIDSLEHIEFLERIMSQGLNITLYAKESLGVINEEIILVLDEDEAISMINNTGSNYSTSVFTDNPAIASKFLQEIKSKQVLVNTSPTIEHFLDIKQSDLYIEKTIIYPVSNKTDGTSTQIKIEQ